MRKVNNFRPDISEMKQLRAMQQTLGSGPPEKPGSEMQPRRNPGTGSAFFKPASPQKIPKHNVDLLPSQLNHVFVQ